MEVICPECYTELKVKKGVMPADGRRARCPVCKEIIFVRPSMGMPDIIRHFDQRLTYVDLEVNREEEIFRVGCYTDQQTFNYDRSGLDDAIHTFEKMHEDGLMVCGHNFRRFDINHLRAVSPSLASWPVLDTLELSILAYPLMTTHKLGKDYKQSDFASNDPLEDAKATRLLLHQIVETLLSQPIPLTQAYAWLLSCGNDGPAQAYTWFWSLLNRSREIPVALEKLPQEALAGFDLSWLTNFWEEAPQKEFDQRLCVAALLTWNHEARLKGSDQIFPAWLNHLPAFGAILRSMRPLFGEGFTYHPYLEKFHIPGFRSIQEPAVQALLAGRNPLVVMPTGGGKSLCYQLPALMLHERQKALTIVISPLQALMDDQVADLKAIGLDFATFINGAVDVRERRHRLESLFNGAKGLVYLSPEQLRSVSIRSLLMDRPPRLWIIDEAHCISQWGHNFRTDYRYVPKFIREVYQDRGLEPPLIGLMTATATMDVRRDIKKLFEDAGLPIHQEITSAGVRSNLTYRVLPVLGDRNAILIEEVRTALDREGSVLVYTTTRKNAKKLAALMQIQGIEAAYYHGRLNKNEKNEVLQRFKNGDLRLVIATCAFGMGINRKDVRAVIHHTISHNLESYLQETGRAGRDGEPAQCVLLFDEKDADTVFSLQGLSRLTLEDLEGIVRTLRGIREKVFRSASEEWFWVGINEVFRESELDEDFASDNEQIEIKIKSALHHLEEIGLIRRAENRSRYIKFDLLDRSPAESKAKFEIYSHDREITSTKVEKFDRLISAMHRAQTFCQVQDEPYSLEQLVDETGVDAKEITGYIRELEKAKVCSLDVAVTLKLNKGVRNDADAQLGRVHAWEKTLWDKLLELGGDDAVQVNLRNVAAFMAEEGHKQVRADRLYKILEGWADRQWVRLTRLDRDTVGLNNLNVSDNLPARQKLAEAIIRSMYAKLGDQKGADLGLRVELGRLIQEVNEITSPRFWTEPDVENALFWMHQQKVILLTDGLNLMQQAVKIKVIKGAGIRSIKKYFPQVEAFYRAQTQRTHYMLEYGRLDDQEKRQKLIEDYFDLPMKEFVNRHPLADLGGALRPVMQVDYRRIMDPLNNAPHQKEIVLSENPAMVVLAGPGSGKTRTIVHRIAYLVKVKRVDPARIMALAYNRNAVRELKTRLFDLVGPMANRLRVNTFHGLALSILGRAPSLGMAKEDDYFESILKSANELLAHGDDMDEEDRQVRRLELLGKVDYIFVDEYQDVAEDEYRLIQLVSGLGDSDDDTQSVQIKLCVIGDDDQNIYSFRNTNPCYLIDFQTEYRAERHLLTENYRSTEPIIVASNRLIGNNSYRAKKLPEEQVGINRARQGQGGPPVRAFDFDNSHALSISAGGLVQHWLSQGVPAREIGIIARHWQDLYAVRLHLNKLGIRSRALKGRGITFHRNYIVMLVLAWLEANPAFILPAGQSLMGWMDERLQEVGRNRAEPTYSHLLHLAEAVDQERGYTTDAASPITAGALVHTIYEYGKTEIWGRDDSVSLSSCHSAKGLEFQKVLFITDGMMQGIENLEAKRRLFYVGMTRAKEELLFFAAQPCRFINETGTSIKRLKVETGPIQRPYFADFEPDYIFLSNSVGREHQDVIRHLKEDDALLFQPAGAGCSILTSSGVRIGSLSKEANRWLVKSGFHPGKFTFREGEVRVHGLYRHMKRNKVTGKLEEDWIVVLPSIQIEDIGDRI